MARTTSNTKTKAAKASPASKKIKAGQQKRTTMTDLQKDKSYIRRLVSKKFSGKIYKGTVVKYTPKHRLWKIQYEDGDGEEMDWDDLSKAMDLHDEKNKKKGVKKEVTPPKQDVKPEAATSTAATNDNVVQNYRVIRNTYPSNGDVNCGDEHVVGEYSTREEANEAARTEMNSTAQFEDWGEDDFAKRPPPYSSADGPFEAIADEDEFVDIYVVDIGKKKKEEERALKAAKASAPPAKIGTSLTPKSDPSKRNFGKITKEISIDPNLFARHPCRIPGGVARDPMAYPNYHKGRGSFGFLIQRLSDRNYAMRALCLNGHGAEYNTYKKARANYISVVWYPPENLEEHAEDATIIDGCHLDMIDPNDGKTYLTGTNLQEAIVNSGTSPECLFLNGAQSNPGSLISADDIAFPISKCHETLRCIALTECKINANLIAAIASCSKLRGLTLENCQLWGEGEGLPTDKKLAGVLRSCPDLRWCFVKSSIFNVECWNALVVNAYPDLKVLWVDSPLNTDERMETARGDHDTIRSALNGSVGKLKLCMIIPDDKNKSRYVIGGAKRTDRLNGRERTEHEQEFLKEARMLDLRNGGGSSYLSTV